MVNRFLENGLNSLFISGLLRCSSRCPSCLNLDTGILCLGCLQIPPALKALLGKSMD